METVSYSAFMQHTVLKPFVEHSNNMNCLKGVFTSGRKGMARMSVFMSVQHVCECEHVETQSQPVREGETVSSEEVSRTSLGTFCCSDMCRESFNQGSGDSLQHATQPNIHLQRC
jgi:hypothetical protein